MKLLPLLALAAASLRVHAAPFDLDKFDHGIKPVQLHELIRATAMKIEERLRGEHPEAERLVERVEALLALPEPEKKDLTDDRAARLAAEMNLASYTASANTAVGGIRGVIFDVTDIGNRQLYQDLKKQQATDADEVRRWLLMRRAARGLSWKNEMHLCQQHAIGAARALVSREPKNALAHALLAYSLDWQDDSSAETLATLQKALQIDPGQPLAQVQLLERKIDKAEEAAAFRRAAGLGDKSPGDVLRQLYDHPLSAEEVAAFEREADSLGKEIAAVLKNAAERKDFAAFMLASELRLTVRYKLEGIAASARRPPEISYEEFSARLDQWRIQILYLLFEGPEHLMKAVELAGDDAEAIGTVAFLAAAPRVMRLMREGGAPDEKEVAYFEGVLRRLVQLARADDSVNAARACEAVSILSLLEVMSGRPPSHPDLLLRAVQLDPFRHRNLNFLVGLCMTLKEHRYATAAAVMEMQLAVLPNAVTRRHAAALAARLKEWDTALRHLDAAQKETPGDLSVLSQRIATLLKQSTSKATVKKAGLLYGDITPDTVLEKTAGMERGARKEFIQNHLYYLLIDRRRDDAGTELKAAQEARILSESEAGEMNEWLVK